MWLRRCSSLEGLITSRFQSNGLAHLHLELKLKPRGSASLESGPDNSGPLKALVSPTRPLVPGQKEKVGTAFQAGKRLKNIYVF